ncbi:MAG: class I SAM-dependent methyltransferase [Paracoccaceae bacterium]|nr:class I SAM-dependent methyltransferase [Paracoccaceae bacterium]
MLLDVKNLNNFYTESPLGRFTKKRLQDSVKKLWGSSLGGQIAGYGFSPPILSLFRNPSQQILCLMPGQQGVISWPSKEKNCSVLAEETSWPIATGSIDRLVVLHGLETSEKLKDLFQEIWRVLAPSGKVIFVVPNRRGWWARSEATPFGQGRPYSVRQLKNQLKLNRFKIEQYLTALYAPPFENLYLLRITKFLENLGDRFYPRFGGGVILLEASKQIYALNLPPLGLAVSGPLNVLEELSDPKPASKTYF